MSRLWQLLHADHDAIWELLDAITGGSAEPPDDPGRQRRLARQLVRLQSAHEFAEERVILPLVRRHCPEGDELAGNLLEQESKLKRALNELYHLTAGTTEFEECVNTVASENRNHLVYEQNQLWPRLDDALSDQQLTQAARRWVVVRRGAPTRPHPHIPVRPWVLSTAGRVVSARDRAADAMRGRKPPDPLERVDQD
jgi:hemerythrin superfamily protein